MPGKNTAQARIVSIPDATENMRAIEQEPDEEDALASQCASFYARLISADREKDKENPLLECNTNQEPLLHQIRNETLKNPISTKKDPLSLCNSNTKLHTPPLLPKKRTETQVPTRILECIQDKNGYITYRSYIRGRFLGKGGFARCYELKCEDTQQLTAVKIVTQSTLTKIQAKQKFHSEINIHRSLQHANVVHFKHFFADTQFAYIILELCQNQSLSDLLRRRKRLSESEVRYYLRQLLQGLAYLHRNLVIHRDLKLGNLFLTEEMQLKIGDFGLATKLENPKDRKKSMCGTPNYIAPEILAGRKGNGHSFQVDIWSTGVVMYTLLIGKPPFETSDVQDTYRRIRCNEYDFPSDICVSENARSLMREILRTDPQSRPSLNAILAHPFFTCDVIPDTLPTTALLITPTKTESLIQKSERPLTEPAGSQKADSDDEMTGTEIIQPQNTMEQMLETLQSLLHDYRLERETQAKLSEHSSTNNIKSRSLQEIEKSKELITAQKLRIAPIWVMQYVDYTSKYGMGYILSNGSSGVYFNDSTKIVTSACGEYFDYLDRSADERHRIRCFIQSYDQVLTKKTTLLVHFHKYLFRCREQNQELCHLQTELERNGVSIIQPQPITNAVANPDINHVACVVEKDKRLKPYVQKWFKSKHAIVFLLTNQTLQVNFLESAILILAESGRVISYMDKGQRMELFITAQALSIATNRRELYKRLTYIKDMLAHLVQLGNVN